MKNPDYLFLPFEPGCIVQDSIIDNIEDQVVLIEDPNYKAVGTYPVKLDAVIAIICRSGTLRGSLDLLKFEISGPGLFIVMPGRVLICDYFSDDFSGLSIVLSGRFWDGFPIDISSEFPISRKILARPGIALKQGEYEILVEFFRLLQKTIRNTGNPNRSTAVRHLVIAFFHGFGYQFHLAGSNPRTSSRDQLVEQFLYHVRENFRQHRDMEFYAERLCLSPNHLSRTIKKLSGKTGSDWISDHVILEAKALLKSTNKTVQQISDELFFPSASFFGKYFKRRTGLSPHAYRTGK